jgi:hypothetical protein
MLFRCMNLDTDNSEINKFKKLMKKTFLCTFLKLKKSSDKNKVDVQTECHFLVNTTLIVFGTQNKHFGDCLHFILDPSVKEKKFQWQKVPFYLILHEYAKDIHIFFSKKHIFWYLHHHVCFHNKIAILSYLAKLLATFVLPYIWPPLCGTNLAHPLDLALTAGSLPIIMYILNANFLFAAAQ